MRKKNLLSLVLPILFLAGAVFIQNIQAQTGQKMTISANVGHQCHLYKCGEKATVEVTVSDASGKLANQGKLVAQFSNDNGKEIRKEILDLAKGNPVTLSETLNFPGFLSIRLLVTGKTPQEKADHLVGIGFEPEKIEPGQPKPNDFEAFLAAGKKEVRDIPIDVQKEKIESLSNDKIDVYEISFATVDKQRVYGFLSIPKNGKEKYPVIINVPGAGPGRGPEIGLAQRGFICLAMNVFPYPVPTNSEKRQQVYNDFNKTIRYTYMGYENRSNYFFRAAYLGIDRAIDWLVAQDNVNKEKVGYFGTSQGGASALILGGMNKNIKFLVSSVPALCDHGGCLKGRASGWPKLIDTAKARKDNVEKVTAAAPYLDGVNFARLIKCPIKVTVGFIDVTCSPSSVYAAYNVIPSQDKEIMNETLLGHRTGKKNIDAVNWLIQKLSE